MVAEGLETVRIYPVNSTNQRLRAASNWTCCQHRRHLELPKSGYWRPDFTVQAMKHFLSILILAAASTACRAEESLKLHPDNSHYLLFRGKPTILLTSGEHYGAVLNTDFDFGRYLQELERNSLNLTRTFSGVYCEDRNSFGITRNTLAPLAGKLACPWS